jgi:hypothetical protein
MLNYMPRFVVLLHETPPGYPRGTHFDLMLEHQGGLRTWALEKLPSGGETVTALRLHDHRLAYLDFEGDVSPGRGRVSRVDAGEFTVTTDDESLLVVAIRGRLLVGRLTLQQTADDPHRWRISLAAGEATS